ncbi:DNA polymerase alpha catalytic subunit, partial [Tanacetum coccineum]
ARAIEKKVKKMEFGTRFGMAPEFSGVVSHSREALARTMECVINGHLVALRLRKLGYTSGCSAGDTVPYIICCEQGKGSSTSAGIGQRARHPDELKKDNENLMIDIDYIIWHNSPSMLADCLGLDPSKFQSKSSEVANNDHSVSVIGVADDEER